MIYTSLIGRPKPLSLESIAPRGGRSLRLPLSLSLSLETQPITTTPSLFRSRPPGIRSSRRFDQISGNNWLVAWPLNSSANLPPRISSTPAKQLPFRGKQQREKSCFFFKVPRKSFSNYAYPFFRQRRSFSSNLSAVRDDICYKSNRFLIFFNLPSPFYIIFLSKKLAITFNLDNFLALNLEKLL